MGCASILYVFGFLGCTGVYQNRAPTQGFKTRKRVFLVHKRAKRHGSYPQNTHSSTIMTEYGLSEYFMPRFSSNSRAAAAEFTMRVGLLNSDKYIMSPIVAVNEQASR